MIDIQAICFLILAPAVAFLCIKYLYLKKDFEFLEKYVNDMSESIIKQDKYITFILGLLKKEALEELNEKQSEENDV